MQDFEISGGYEYHGGSGTFTGILRSFQDNRLVGTMNDSGTDIIYNRGQTKLILGLMQDDMIGFWKFSPSQFTPPLMYSLKKEGEMYRGKWCAIEIYLAELSKDINSKKGMPEIIDALNCEKAEGALEILSKVEKERIIQHLNKTLLQRIFQISPATGYLTLNPIESFAA